VKLNILIPMAGKGKRFKAAGYVEPKPLIPIAGRLMIEWSLESLAGTGIDPNFIFVALQEDLDRGLRDTLGSKGKIVAVPEVTEGAVNTTLLASHLIDAEYPLVVANCDQFLEWNFREFLESSSGYDCSVVVFESDNPHHSFIEAIGPDVIRVKEKEVISTLAIGGIYFYRKASDYFLGASELLRNNDRTNGEFYITPIFNHLIKKGKKVTYFVIDNERKHMLGTPEEVRVFLEKMARGKESL
jgi:dTDP-glucose pyrophosphorylase